MVRTTDSVVPLDQMSDYKVADEDPDVRGWDVKGADGARIGSVDNLLVDSAARKVRYLDIDLDEDLIDRDDRHILVPIGYARLDENDDDVFVGALTATRLEEIPAYRHEPITREYETNLRRHFVADGAQAPADNDFYADDIYDSDRFYEGRRDQDATVTRSEEELAIGKREQRAGEVDVEKHVEHEHVSENVPTRHEEVVVERRPATGAMNAKPRIEDDEVRIPVKEEELIVEKRTVPKEEIVVSKRETVENERVEADLRREEVDIHREGDVEVREDR